MKKQLAVLMMTAAGFAMSAFPSAAAAIRVTVPFAFEAGQATLPAGTYEVNYGAHGGAISVWNVEQNRTMLVPARPNGNANEAKPGALVFQHAGGTYHLTGVRMLGARVLTVPAPKVESLVAHSPQVTDIVEVPAGQ